MYLCLSVCLSNSIYLLFYLYVSLSLSVHVSVSIHLYLTPSLSTCLSITKSPIMTVVWMILTCKCVSQPRVAHRYLGTTEPALSDNTVTAKAFVLQHQQLPGSWVSLGSRSSTCLSTWHVVNSRDFGFTTSDAHAPMARAPKRAF